MNSGVLVSYLTSPSLLPHLSGALFWATTNQAFLNYGAVLGVRKRSPARPIEAMCTNFGCD